MARASGAASWNRMSAADRLAERDGDEVGERREPVDRAVWVGDEVRLVRGGGDGRGRGVSRGFFTAAICDRGEPGPLGRHEVGDERPFVLDVLGEEPESVRRLDGGSDELTDGL